ncbi:MAG: hypothetical protein WDM81_07560 [Rhizomicrobium sp.]
MLRGSILLSRCGEQYFLSLEFFRFGLNCPKATVIARFMRATQFGREKNGCPDKPGNDDFNVGNFESKRF